MKTVKCSKIQRMVMEYIDGLLKPVDNDILLKHISQCENCRNYFENIKKIRFYLGKLKVKEPVYLESKIMARISEQDNIREKARLFDFGFIFKPALSFAVSSLIIIGSIFFIYNKIGDSKLASINLPEKKIEKIARVKNNNNTQEIKITQKETDSIKLTDNQVIAEKTEIKVSENAGVTGQIKVKSNNIIKSDEPKYSLSKVDDINLKMAKEIATPSTTNPLLERDKAIIGNNMINPLKGEYCIIKVKVEESARVRIIIYDKRIKVVANLIDEQKEPGVYEVKWYGRNSAGDILSEGVYFVFIQIGSNVIKKNVIIVK